MAKLYELFKGDRRRFWTSLAIALAGLYVVFDLDHTPFVWQWSRWDWVYAIRQIVIVSAIAGGALYVLWEFPRFLQSDNSYSQRIKELQQKADEHPDRARTAWELASVHLEQYFARNLKNIKAIFWVSVGAMIAGFVTVLYAISHAIADAAHPNTAYLAAIAGVITEFIGATFMLMYRSTVKQADSYVQTLERINVVGMAVQILDTIKIEKDEHHLINATKAELVKKLIELNVKSHEDG